MMILLTTFDFARPVLVNLDCVVKIESYTARAAEAGKGSKDERTGCRLTTVNNVQERTEEASRPTDVRETLIEILAIIDEQSGTNLRTIKNSSRERRGKKTVHKNSEGGNPIQPETSSYPETARGLEARDGNSPQV